MGGKGGGASIPQELEDSARQLLDIGREQFDLGLPILQQGAAQGLDILGGGVGAFGPAIRSQLELARSNASAQNQQLREQLTTQGITGTALQEALAQNQLKTNATVADVPNQFLRPTLEAAAGQTLGLVPQSLQSIQSAASAGAAGAVPGRQSGGVAGALGGGASGALAGGLVAGPIGAAIGGLGGAAKGGK